MNIIQIAGHLGSDPVTRFTASGQKVTSFTIATNIKRGESTITVWYRITVWGDRMDKMLSFLKKGSAVIVVGELQKPEIYTDKEGRQQISLEVWADIVRFSPFGKPSEQRSGQESAGHYASSGMQNSGQSFGGYGGQAMGEDSHSKGGEYAYKGYGQSSQDAAEEPLPF